MKKEDKFIKYISGAIIFMIIALLYYKFPNFNLFTRLHSYMDEQDVREAHILSELFFFGTGIYLIILAIINTVKSKKDDE